jgi:hypothetical protein
MNNHLSNIVYTLVITALSISNLFPQDWIEERTGEISYRSAQNIYVKFDSTSGIKLNDTLFLKDKYRVIPVITIKFISSKSCAGELINGKELKIGDKLVAYVYHEFNKEIAESQVNDTLINKPDFTKNKSDVKIQEKRKSFRKSGRISVQSYSSFSNESRITDYQRWRYSFSYNAERIGDGKFSLFSYINFAYRADEWQKVSSGFGKSVRVYDLALKYNFNETTSILLGRHINRRVSNLSSVDGVQFEKSFSSWFAGFIAGSRPDFSDMGYNLKLFEYGGYLGRSDTVNDGILENTIGAFQQTNDFKTDRRFVYFQHSNSIFSELNFFFSAEADLFKKERGMGKSDFSLTSLFASARYAPLNFISFSLSFDARKNIIYYETFKSFTDSLIENETRQGIRFGTNIRPLKNLFIGFNGGYRYQKNDLKPSRNFSGYISYSGIPVINTSSTLSYNKILSSFIDGDIWGVRLSQNIIGNYDFSVTYRNTNYTFLSGIKSNQNSLLADISGKIIESFYITLSYEGIFDRKKTDSRILIGLTSRF